MQIDVRNDNAGVVLELRAALTGPAAQELQQVVETQLDADRSDITLDLRGVPMVDSAGLEELLRCHDRCATAGGALRLINAGDKIKRILRITRLDRELCVA